MPDWITNKVKASSHVIEAMLNEDSHVDFNRIISFDGEFPWDEISVRAKFLAEVLTQDPESDHAIIIPVVTPKRQDVIFKELGDQEFEQFVQMLRNFRKSKALHDIDFARKHWGTKWNAYNSKTDLQAGITSFETANSCPRLVLQALSERFPDEIIEVRFADDELGAYCGTFTLKSGKHVASDIAPAWDDQTDEEKAKWRAFACEFKGYDPFESHEAE